MEEYLDERVAIEELFSRVFEIYQKRRYSFTFESTINVFVEVLNDIIKEKQHIEECKKNRWDSSLSLKKVALVDL